MIRLGFVSVLVGACFCAAARVDAQGQPERLGVRPALNSSASVLHSSRSLPPVSANSAQKTNRTLMWSAVAIGAGTGAALGALWGRHVDKQQICPAAGPCGGRSNVGPYALVGAGIGGVLGAVVWLARDR
jgi:uncharacterized membrane protein YgdD (TMEM256/DUF423 family)